MNNLTKEEKEILESFEKGEWRSKGGSIQFSVSKVIEGILEIIM